MYAIENLLLWEWKDFQSFRTSFAEAKKTAINKNHNNLLLFVAP